MEWDLDDYLNFDFLGSFVTWENMKLGKHSDGKDDDFMTNGYIGLFYVKGLIEC